MNYSTAVFLINKNVRAIACTYEKDTDAKKADRVVHKSLKISSSAISSSLRRIRDTA
jgi:hypothetical protein